MKNINIVALRKSLGLKQTEFATQLGIAQSYISEIERGVKPITEEVYSKLNIAFGCDKVESFENINPSSNKIIDSEEELERAKAAGLQLLPEVNFEFSGGTTEIFTNTEFIKRYWYLPDCKDCDGVAQVAGTSMLPSYPPGCWVALKRVGFNMEFPNEIPFGQVFGVVIEDSITGMYHGHIKVLRRHRDYDLSKKFWIARSLNVEEFDDFDIKLETVRGLWIVKQHIVSDVIL